jgi:hypothetical protein
MATKYLMRYCSGLNTVDPPERLSESELQFAKNIIINQAGRTDDNGRELGIIDRADGHARVQTFTAGHSLFCNGFDCLVADGTTLYLVGADNSLLSLTTFLSGNKISYFSYGTATYFTDGVTNGIVDQGALYSWDADTNLDTDSKVYYESEVPVFEHISELNGQMYGSIGNALYVSEPGYFGLWNLERMWMFGSDILMHVPVRGGLFVSDTTDTWFLRGSTIENFSLEHVADYPALAYSRAHSTLEGSDFGLSTPIPCALWLSPEGVCAGLADGTFINMTEEKIIYPGSGQYGATLIRGDHIVATIDSTFSTDTNVKVGPPTEKATTQRDSFTFNSYCKRKSDYLSCATDGLYLLGGSTFNGTAIASTFETRTWDVDSHVIKRCPYIYLTTAETSGSLTVTPVVNGVDHPAVTTTEVVAAQNTAKARVGRGSKGEYWAARVQNIAGADFSVAEVKGLFKYRASAPR